MDYPVAQNRWRTRALIFAAVAALELAVLVTVGAFTIGSAFVAEVEGAARAHELPPPKPRPAPTVPGRPLLERSETSVVVLNANGIAGAAAAGAAKVRAVAYVVSSVGNAPRSDYAKSVVMFRDGYRREAERLAADVGVKLVGPLDGLRDRDLMGAHLALLLGK